VLGAEVLKTRGTNQVHDSTWGESVDGSASTGGHADCDVGPVDAFLAWFSLDAHALLLVCCKLLVVVAQACPKLSSNLSHQSRRVDVGVGLLIVGA
jgi:hypothetical protein